MAKNGRRISFVFDAQFWELPVVGRPDANDRNQSKPAVVPAYAGVSIDLPPSAIPMIRQES